MRYERSIYRICYEMYGSLNAMRYLWMGQTVTSALRYDLFKLLDVYYTWLGSDSILHRKITVKIHTTNSGQVWTCANLIDRKKKNANRLGEAESESNSIKLAANITYKSVSRETFRRQSHPQKCVCVCVCGVRARSFALCEHRNRNQIELFTRAARTSWELFAVREFSAVVCGASGRWKFIERAAGRFQSSVKSNQISGLCAYIKWSKGWCDVSVVVVGESEKCVEIWRSCGGRPNRPTVWFRCAIATNPPHREDMWVKVLDAATEVSSGAVEMEIVVVVVVVVLLCFMLYALCVCVWEWAEVWGDWRCSRATHDASWW